MHAAIGSAGGEHPAATAAAAAAAAVGDHLPFTLSFAERLPTEPTAVVANWGRRTGMGCHSRMTAAAWLLLLIAVTAADVPPCDLAHLSGLLGAAEVSWRAPQAAGSIETLGSGSGGGAEALPRLHLGRCQLRRFTREEARECLAGGPGIGG